MGAYLKLKRMNKEFIPYEQALELKELGFTITFDGWFYINGSLKWDYLDKEIKDKDCHAPLYQQAFRWFREKYGLYGQIDIMNSFLVNGIIDIYFMFCIIDKNYFNKGKYNDKSFNTYKKAELACLKKLIEIAKNK